MLFHTLMFAMPKCLSHLNVNNHSMLLLVYMFKNKKITRLKCLVTSSAGVPFLNVWMHIGYHTKMLVTSDGVSVKRSSHLNVGTSGAEHPYLND